MTDLGPLQALAIDGGGTGCRLAACFEAGEVIAESGPANVTTDFDGAVQAIGAGLETLAAKAALGKDQLFALPTVAGLAGVKGNDVADSLRAALPFRDLRILEDRIPTVRGALGVADGFLAHCGTGSFFAAQRAGDIQSFGGWGPVLGDDASAYWIGRETLRMVLDAVDGLRDASELSDDILTSHGGPEGLVTFAASAGQVGIAGLAPRVTYAADAGDAIGLDVLQSGAAIVAASLEKLGWTRGDSVCLAGGVSEVYGKFLPEGMQKSLMAAKGAPIDGAIALARELAEC